MARPAKKTTDEEYTALVEKISADFNDRLTRMAAEPAQWVEFIEQVAVFGAQYSLGNQILLLGQAEERGVEPRYFLPFGNKEGTSGWLKHKRAVRKGEKSFKIWAPVKRRPTEEQAATWEGKGQTIKRDTNGRPSMQVTGFRLASTFELSQTDGEPFEPPTVAHRRRESTLSPQLLTGGDPTDAYDDLIKLVKDHGYSYDLVEAARLGGANGRTQPSTRQVLVRDDISPAQRIKTTVHELAHVRCGHVDGEFDYVAHRGRAETEAESVAHIVCKALGLDSDAYSDAYVFTWANGDMDLIKQCAETVLRVAKQILRDLTPADTTDADTE